MRRKYFSQPFNDGSQPRRVGLYTKIGVTDGGFGNGVHRGILARRVRRPDSAMVRPRSITVLRAGGSGGGLRAPRLQRPAHPRSQCDKLGVQFACAGTPPPVTPFASTNAARATGYLLLFSGMALVGTYTALSKPLSEAMPVFLLAWLRFAIAAVVMIPWLRPTEGEAPLTPRLWQVLFVQSLFGNFLFSILMLTGVSLTSAAAAGIVMAALPPLVALLSWAVLREHAGRRVWAATGLAAGAIALLSSNGTVPPGGGHLLGNVLILGAAVCEAIYVVLGKRLTGSLSPRRISALINLVGLALMTPLGLWQASRFDFAQISGSLWALLVFYSLSASMISTWLWLSGMKQVPASHSGVFTVALPIAATLVAVAVLGEAVGVLHLVALGCAVAGIALVAWPDASDKGQPGGEPH